MKGSINSGIYPTMLVAYTSKNEIDYPAMRDLIEWYIAEGVHGIFALCHSTEIHCLSREERLELARFVLKQVNGRVSVVIGGVTAPTFEGQLEEAPLFAALKPDALVLISNRLAPPDGGSMVENVKRIMSVLPQDLPLGIYECPQPYKRIVRDDEFSFMAHSGRFAFIKDT
ncbi:MAG: dihydrodipicolinate synthase family protein, partial [Clostridia bacterium]|nr:dihydrodipicolinate synthase family protein [Clostridia bacterium]